MKEGSDGGSNGEGRGGGDGGRNSSAVQMVVL